MTSDAPEKTAEHAVAQLFDAAGIKRIVCVDDVYAASSDTFLETLAGLTAEQRASVFGAPDDEFTEEDIWQERVRKEWATLADPERASLVDKASAVERGADPVGIGAIHALGNLLPEKVTLEGLSLSKWREQREAVIAELETNPTLILFDQDFSNEGGASDDGQTMISELETALSKLDPRPDAYYGLLTNTIAEEDEQARRQQIVSESGVDAARLVVISKRNLDDNELGRFTERLRTTLLAPIFAALVSEVTQEVEKQQKAAIDRVMTIAPEDMEHMVVRSSDREGEWAPDTLVRILEAMERAKVREQLRVAPRVGDLAERLQRIAALASPSEARARDPQLPTVDPGDMTPATPPIPHPVAVEILREEIYDNEQHINTLHLPIELGDLIERPSDGQLWIVVAQPCHLMVREKGKREPELTHMILARVEEGDIPANDLFSEFELPYYFDNGGKAGIVQLSRSAHVRAVIPDSCVLNTDGVARLDLKAESPARLLPHWQTRHNELMKIGKMLFDRTGQVKKSALTMETFAGHYKGDPFSPTKVDRDNSCIEWDCRRVGRIGDPYARALLTRFSQYFARDAYLNDLARQ